MTEQAGEHRLVPRWVPLADGPAEVTLRAGGVTWTAKWPARAGECFETPGPSIPLRKGPFRVEVESRGEHLVLDGLAIRPGPPAPLSGKGVDN
jgi:hypothetical protein